MTIAESLISLGLSFDETVAKATDALCYDIVLRWNPTVMGYLAFVDNSRLLYNEGVVSDTGREGAFIMLPEDYWEIRDNGGTR